jgi:chemotaxis protein CheY-P-specific phosphatase CheC
MGQQDLSVIKDKEINQDQVNESMVQDTLQIMMSESRKQLKNKKCEQKPPLKPRKSGVLE